MRTFLTVVETGSFVETSEVLFMTPSTVSKHVAALEGALGIQLLMRNARRVTLTKDGQSCIAEIRSIVDSYDVLRQKLEKMM